MTESKKPFKGYNKKKHSRTGGLNDKYRKKLNREEGSNLKRPVTGKVEPGSKAAKRRKSFCSRMSGVKGPTSKDGELTPKGAALKRWKCHKSLQKSDITPKQKLASFLREHIDNKLALKAAEPTITKSNEPYSESLEKKSAIINNVLKKNDEKHYSRAHVENHINNMFVGEHDEDENPESGIPDLHASNFYKLAKVPLSSIPNESVPSKHLVREYKNNYLDGSDFPPIVLSVLNNEIMDGRHRVQAAKELGHTHINAFVPIKDKVKKSNTLVGGKGDNKDISDFDAKEVEMGMRVEMEHTKDVGIAKEIVADHLSEDPEYYSKLKGSGLADELNKAGRCWDGYEPTPGKKPYSKGSCRKIKKSELNKSDVSLHLINQFEGSPTSPTEHHYAVKHKGQEVGRAIVFDKDPKSIHNAGKIGPSLKDIRLKPEHQGKGLSGQIINKLVETHGPLASDSRGNISEAGAKMFAKYGTKQLDNSYVLSGGKMQKTYHQKLIKALKCKCQEKELKKSISAMAIEAGEYQGEKLDSHHHNRIGQEYRSMAVQAHKEGNRTKAREYHEKALMHFRKADEMGFQEEEPLEKKISGKLVGAGLAAAAALTPATPFKEVAKLTAPVAIAKPAVQEQPKVGPPADISKYKTVSPEAANRLFSLGFGKNPEDKFLHNIMQSESTGGKDINHPSITNKKSKHYGTTAFGYWALMPLTVQEIAGRYARQGGKDPRILKIPQMSKHDVNHWLAKNPDVELELARTLARHVTSRFGNTPKAAYAWKYGHNQKDISEEKALKDTYIQKFKDLNEGKSTELTRGLIPASQAFGSN